MKMKMIDSQIHLSFFKNFVIFFNFGRETIVEKFSQNISWIAQCNLNGLNFWWFQSPKWVFLFRKMFDSTKNFIISGISNSWAENLFHKSFLYDKNSRKKRRRKKKNVANDLGSNFLQSRSLKKITLAELEKNAVFPVRSSFFQKWSVFIPYSKFFL